MSLAFKTLFQKTSIFERCVRPLNNFYNFMFSFSSPDTGAITAKVIFSYGSSTLWSNPRAFSQANLDAISRAHSDRQSSRWGTLLGYGQQRQPHDSLRFVQINSTRNRILINSPIWFDLLETKFYIMQMELAKVLFATLRS